MRYQSWMLLIAGLFTLPHLAFSAGAWGVPEAYSKEYATSAGIRPESTSLRPYSVPTQHIKLPHYAEMAAQMRAQGYRFRPLDRASPSREHKQGRYPQQPARSYRGGMPPEGWRATARERVAVQVPQSRYPWQMGQHWSTQGYRFRPLPPARQARVERTIRYRPLQLQIPERYVFRPLNPVAPAAAPMRYRPPAAPYPPLGYTMAGRGFRPHAYDPYNLRTHASYAVPPHAPAPSSAVAPVSRQSQRMSLRTAYPWADARDMSRMPRFRPWSYAGRNRNDRWIYAPSYARRSPAWHYPTPVQLPAWAYQHRPPLYSQPTYGSAAYTEQRPTVPPTRLNRYGADWYDGRGDGEGAWYRLALETTPDVSPSW